MFRESKDYLILKSGRQVFTKEKKMQLMWSSEVLLRRILEASLVLHEVCNSINEGPSVYKWWCEANNKLYLISYE